MTKKHPTSVTASSATQRAALTSPIRLEIIGLFTATGPLSISDMAEAMGRPAGSLYHHVGLLEKAGFLQRAGTRPKGKRFETLYETTGSQVEIEVPPGDDQAVVQAVQAMKAAFRMTTRDLAAALERPDIRKDGPLRNTLAMRVHLRASPRLLEKLNKHIGAIENLLVAEAAGQTEPDPENEHLSLTLALLPLRGRDARADHAKESDE